MLRLAGINIGKAQILSGVEFKFGPINIEDGVFLNHGVLLDASGAIDIGRNVHIGHRCSLITATHIIGGSIRRAGPAKALAVAIEEGAWLGANVTILPGVTVAKGCIIAAGSVVTKSTEADGLYAGVPAKRIRMLNVDTI